MNSDEPAEPGELGRLVVTDYYNKTFPMVRYDTGDTGIMRMYQDEKGGCMEICGNLRPPRFSDV